MNLRSAVLETLRRHRPADADGLLPESVAYALRRDFGLTADVHAVKLALSALDGDHLAFHVDGEWIAVGQPARRRCTGRGFRRNGTAPHRVRRSDVPMRGSVLIDIPQYLDG